MNKPQELANYIIKEAYKNDGYIDFDNLDIDIDIELLPSINEILEEYGSLSVVLSNDTWDSYSLSNYGSDFASRGAFQGLEKERKEKDKDRRIDRTAKRFSILAVIIAFISLIVSIISICI